MEILAEEDSLNIKHSPSDDFKVTNKIDRVNLEFFISSYIICRSIKERSVLGVFIWYVLRIYIFIRLKPLGG